MTGKVQPYKAGFGPMMPEVYHVPFPMAYHGISVEDSLQALMLAIRIIPSFLEANFLSRGTLTCDGAPWNLGLGVQLDERGA